MSRDDLNPMFRRWPRWLLWTALAVWGIPYHVAVCVYQGFWEGIDNFRHEWEMMKRLDL